MGGATTEEDGLHLFGRMHPDLLLLTQDPEIGSGIRLMRSVHEHSPDTRMLIFLSRGTQDVVEEKLQMLSAGGVYCPEDVRRTLVSLDFDQQAKFVEHLREREKEAVCAVARGLTNSELQRLFRSPPKRSRALCLTAEASLRYGSAHRSWSQR